MADRQTGMTPAREGRQVGLSRPSGLASGPFRTLQRFADEMDRMFDDVGLGRRWTSPWRETADLWAPDVEVFQKNNELTINCSCARNRRGSLLSAIRPPLAKRARIFLALPPGRTGTIGSQD